MHAGLAVVWRRDSLDLFCIRSEGCAKKPKKHAGESSSVEACPCWGEEKKSKAMITERQKRERILGRGSGGRDSGTPSWRGGMRMSIL